MRAGAALEAASASLQEAGVESARLDAQLLLAHALHLPREDLLLQDRALEAAHLQSFEAMIARRAAREPVSHILGYRAFYGRRFAVSADTLDPRPDSETLIEALLAWRIFPSHRRTAADRRVLDLGTGSGCLLLTLLAEMPGAYGVGVDISEPALFLARANAEALCLRARAHFVRGRWAEAISGRFDLVACNPPYIASQEIETLMPEVRDFEPRCALDGGKDGLDCYREIAHQLPHVLAPNGLAALEIGIHQHAAVSRIMAAAGLTLHAITPDLSGIPRCVLVQAL